MSELKIIKFEKPSCAPCIAVSEMLNKAGIKYETINYIAGFDAAMELGVKSVPTVFAIKEVDGKKTIVQQFRGADPKEFSNFVEELSSYCNSQIKNEN